MLVHTVDELAEVTETHTGVRAVLVCKWLSEKTKKVAAQLGAFGTVDVTVNGWSERLYNIIAAVEVDQGDPDDDDYSTDPTTVH